MTWSIVARDDKTGRFAVAVTTCAFAVGARVPFGAGRIGAIATQAMVNPLYGVDGLRFLRDGLQADEIIAALVRTDPGAAHRQVHLMDRDGAIAVHTGAECIPWCGAVAAPQVSVAGNMLAGAAVVEETLRAYLAHEARDFDERLILALEAGQAAGGDKRGKQSAALMIWDQESVPVLDLRVDDHAAPLLELRRLWRKAHERYVPFQAACATRTNPGGVTDRMALDALIERHAKAWRARNG